MWVIWGFLAGNVLGRIGFLRAAAVWIMLYALSGLVFVLVWKNVDRQAGVVAGIAVPVSLCVWALWNPARNRFTLWMVDGAYLGARLGMWVCVAMMAVRLFRVDFHLPASAAQAWTWAAGGVVLWIIQKALMAQVLRSHRIAAQREAAIEAQA